MNANPGWYPAPNEHATQRYWNGEAWTEDRAPLEVKDDGGLIVAGWVCAFLFPLVGFIIGLVLMGKGRGDGAAIVLSSIAVTILGFLLLVG